MLPSESQKSQPSMVVGSFLSSPVQIPEAMRGRLAELLKMARQTAEPHSDRDQDLQALAHAVTSGKVSDLMTSDGAGPDFRLTQQEVDWMSRQPETRWLDYLTHRYQFKIYPRLRKLRAFPLHLLLEPTSICNLRCVMCFQTDTSFTKKEFMGMMPWELFVNVVDQANAFGCQAITLASRGEPTLHPRFGEMLLHVSKAGILDLKINSNATKLTEKLTHDILSAGVNVVVFSVDAATKDTYENIRVGGKFEEVVANIERFNTIRAKHYPQSQTVTRISGILVRDDQDQDQMSTFWRQFIDEVTLEKAMPRWDSYSNDKALMSPHPCTFLWERMYVWHDGTVNPCDFDYKSYLSVGNANQTPLNELWRGEKYQRLRDAHARNRRRSFVPCDRCPIY